ncbi:threonine-phosphate decarboxylase [Paenibacillus sp. J31TS4]|uniref:threonine-phosphate decarboxylase CobD n=1 Tax=Paenibacillus sp. J31TS4 TaxID=2807195 RepID=UPI001B206BAF|nr:threonine-phosphate decarboxylase CobD [Paenibacillus sp. J31TS4]GIP38779.1 threonine-phosphate decarboxylase [Paenibacillus sp. J31TS4]
MLEQYGHGGDLLTAEETYGLPRERMLDFSSNMNPFGPPPAVRELLPAYAEEIMRYPDPACRELRRKLADVHGVPMDAILAGNGAAELIDLAVRVWQPRTTALALPSFSEYEEAANKAGSRLVGLQLRAEAEFRLEPHHLEAASGSEVVFLGHPNNPTGRLLDPAYVETLLEAGCRVILDEAFLDFTAEEESLSFLRRAAQTPSLIVLRSVTKLYAIPGIRLGYAVAHPETIAAMRTLQVPWSVNSLAQRIGTAVLDDPAYRKQLVEWLPVERDWFAGELRKLGLEPFPSATNYLLVRLPAALGHNARSLQAQLGRLGLLIRDASRFPGLDDSFCRLAIRLRRENEALLAGLRQVLGQPDGPGHPQGE